MQVIGKLEDMRAGGACSLALGAFDGLHRGHMAVVHAAAQGGGQPRVFTFVEGPKGAPALLTPEDKLLLLEQAGIRQVYRMDFESLRHMEAQRFVEEILFAKCGAARLCCGEDFRFGKGAAGDVRLLETLCCRAGVQLSVVPPVTDGGGKVSSTRIRAAIEQGDIPAANRLLGRPFGFSQEVIHGNHIGHSLGTPTINQALPEGFVRPRFGVYAAWCLVGGGYHYGVTNIGVKPTVGSDQVLAETWMPGFSGDLYGKHVRLFLLGFLRPERKFPSLDELRDEIKRNAKLAGEIAAQCPPPGFGGEGRPSCQQPI